MLNRNAPFKSKLRQNIETHKNLYVLNGIVFIVLGLFCFAMPLAAAEFLGILIGLILVITGSFQLYLNFATTRHWSYYISAFIFLAAGALMILQPNVGAVALGAIVTTFLLLQGCMQLFYAGLYAPFYGWVWMLASGVLSILLAALVFSGWPSAAGWFLGILIGINLISFGASMLLLANFINKIDV